MASAKILLILLATGFAGQSGWSSDSSTTPAATSNYDRYGQPIGTSGSAAGPPPSITSRAQQAFTETGTTLRDGVDAGIRAANDQLQTVGNNFRTVADQSFGRNNNQLQPISPIGTTSAPPSTTSVRGKNAVSPPPWANSPSSAAPSFSSPSTPTSTSGQFVDRTASPGMVPTRTDTGWTSIGPSVAAPPLLIPQLPAATSSATQSRLTTANNGPNFPATIGAQQDGNQERSVLTNNPSQPAARSTTTNDWATGWTNNPSDSGATIGRTNSNMSGLGSTVRNSDLVAVQQPNSNASATAPASQQSGTNWDDPWGGAESWGSQNSQRPAAGTNPGGAQTPSISANPSLGTNQSNQSPLSQTVGGPAITASSPVTATPTGGNVQLPNLNRDAQAASNGQPQWLTLAVVLLSLVGSLSANVFLGMSYMDARQKYQSLVRRTADSFRRSTAAVA